MSKSGIETPIVTTKLGPIKGRECIGVYGGKYYSFEGIPFAKPPVEELRFKAPQPAEPWTDVRECFEVAEKPLQKMPLTGEYEGSEDCLYLNIYTKRLHGDKALPVMIYIYGGGFTNGGATRRDFGPDYFMEQEVILITFNYRLGALGFLSLPDSKLQIPGNAGLKDQHAVLRWVQENCAQFNGDPNNVTLFGNSAGSASTHFQMLNPNGKGLFHKAILQSGTAYNPWAVTPQRDYAFRLAQHQGYTGKNTDEDVLAFLQQLPGAKLMGEELLDDADRLQDVHYAFGPTVEPYMTDHCIVPAPPRELQRTSWSNEIPLIIGGTTYESLVLYARVRENPTRIQGLKVMPQLAMPHETRKNKSAEECKALGMRIVEQHVPKDDTSILPLLDVFSYKSFWLGFQRVVLARLAYALPATPTYLYSFDFYSEDFNFHRLKYCGSDSVAGVAHGDELSYLFYGERAWKLNPESDEHKTLQRMVGMWTAFATNSNPNCPAIVPTKWKAVNPVEETPMCLHITSEVEMSILPAAEKLQIWLGLYDSADLF